METSVRRQAGTKIALLGSIAVALLFVASGCKTYQKTVKWMTPTKPAPILSSRGGVVPAPYERPAPASSQQTETTAPSTPGTGETTIAPLPGEQEKSDLGEMESKEEKGMPEPEDVETEELTHTVQKGESLWEIGQEYDVSFKELAAHNDMDPNDVLKEGTKLKIPPGGKTGAEVTSTPEGTPGEEGGGGDIEERAIPPDNKYTVEKGDSLWKISKMFGVPMDRIRSLNDLSSDSLQIGQVLVLKENGSGASGEGGRGNSAPPITDDDEEGDDDDDREEDDDRDDHNGNDDDDGTPSPEPPTTNNSFPQTLEHTVSSDETLEMIANMYETSVEKIIKANEGIESSEDLEPETTITVPYE